MIRIYTKNFCPYCVKAKNLLDSLGVNYEEIDITHTPEVIEIIKKQSGMRTVPQVFIDDICLGGFSDIESLHKRGLLMKKLSKETD